MLIKPYIFVSEKRHNVSCTSTYLIRSIKNIYNLEKKGGESMPSKQELQKRNE